MVSKTHYSVLEICDQICLYGLYGAAFFLPISKALLEIFCVIAIFAYLVKKLSSHTDIPITAITIAVLLYSFVSLYSVYMSTNIRISIREFVGNTLEEILFFFVVVETLNSKQRITRLLAVFFASAFLLGVDGIFQYITRIDFLRHRTPIFYDKISACFATPNGFGCYLNMIIPFSFVFVVSKLRLGKIRYLLAVLTLLLFSCLILTSSRGAWFSFIASILFMSLFIRSLILLIVTLTLVILLAYPFMPVFVKERMANLLSTSDAGSMERKIFWKAGFNMFLSRPWIGLGLGTFMFNFKQFVDPTYPYGSAYAHNCYLQIASESGMFGLFAFLCILAVYFWISIQTLLSHEKSFYWYVLLASSTAILGYALHMSVDTIFYGVDLGMLFWFILGVGMTARESICHKVAFP